MTNYEKYKDEITEAINECVLGRFMNKHVLKKEDDDFGGYNDGTLDVYETTKLLLWFMQEYEEPKVDWSKVAVDTKVLVRNRQGDSWLKRYFAKYEDGRVYTFDNGATSWACDKYFSSWNYAKLAEDGE